MANALERRTATTRSATPCPRRARALEVGARRALDPHGAAVRAGPHQPVAAARRDRRPRRLDHGRLLHRRRDEAKAQWEQVFATQLEGLPVLRVIVTHMHPDHIGLAHWLCERWHVPPVDQRHRLQRGAHRLASSTTGFGGEGAARFFAAHGLTDPEAHRARSAAARNYYPRMVPEVPRALPPPAGRRRRAHRRRATGAASRLRPRARAHRAVLRGAAGADQRRHGAAAHLDQRQRATTSSPRPTRCALFLESIAGSGAARRHAGAALARQAVPRPARSASAQLHEHHRDALAEVLEACARGAAVARPTCCRCCSSASSTCTRRPSRWASRWRTCTRCGSPASCAAGASAATTAC